MKDIELRLADQPGSLAAMALTLGEAGISVEGGGVFVADGIGIAHFLIADHHAATAADALRRRRPSPRRYRGRRRPRHRPRPPTPRSPRSTRRAL